MNPQFEIGILKSKIKNAKNDLERLTKMETVDSDFAKGYLKNVISNLELEIKLPEKE